MRLDFQIPSAASDPVADRFATYSAIARRTGDIM